MKKTLLQILWITGLIITGTAIAQPAIEWQKTYGGTYDEGAHSIQQTSDGGYIVSGYTGSTDGDVTGHQGAWDYWVIRLDSSGNLIWQKALGGSDIDYARSIQQTADGGFIVAGLTSSNDGDVTGAYYSGDFWLVKLNASGDLQWQKVLGGGSLDFAYSVQQTSDGGYILAGQSSSNNGDVTGNNGASDFWVVKVDATGNLMWQKSLGGSAIDIARSVQQTTDGGYIVAGETYSNNGDVTGHQGAWDYWVVKLDNSGSLIWEKTLGGSDHDYAQSVQQTTDGGYIIAGYSSSTDGDISQNIGNDDFWVVKLDDTGNLLWEKSLGSLEEDRAYSIHQTTDGGYLVGGYTNPNTGNSGNYLMIRIDDTGNLLWQKELGGTGTDRADSVKQTMDEGYIISGFSGSTDGDVTGNIGGNDIWIVKLEGDNMSTDDAISFEAISIYPNPSKDIIIIDNLPNNATLKITDMTGKEIYNTITKYQKVMVSTSGFSNGVYIIQVEKNGNALNKKLIVNR